MMKQPACITRVRRQVAVNGSEDLFAYSDITTTLKWDGVG